MEEESRQSKDILGSTYINQNNEISISQIPLIPDNEHYLCNKCFTFPKITFINEEKIKFICKCEEEPEKEIPIKKIFEYITNQDIENVSKFHLKCNIHNKPFSEYCPECKINLCSECDCDDNSHELIHITRNREIDLIIDKIRNSKQYKKYINNEYELSSISLSNEEDKIKYIRDKNEENYLNKIESNVNKINDKTDLNFDKENECLNKEEEPNINYIFKLVVIIFNDYKNYKHYNHIKNIKNFYQFFISNYIEKKEIEIKYKIDYSLDTIKLFGETFKNNNIENCYLIIDNKEVPLCEDFCYDKNKKEDFLIVKLIEKEKKVIFDISNMFDNCSSLITLSNISKWNTNDINNMSHMFSCCVSLESLPENISKWDTSNVSDMSYLFYNCKSLTKIPDISNWNTNKVNNMNFIFYGCDSLSFLPMINFEKVKEKNNIFNSIDIYLIDKEWKKVNEKFYINNKIRNTLETLIAKRNLNESIDSKQIIIIYDNNKLNCEEYYSKTLFDLKFRKGSEPLFRLIKL